MVMLLGSHIYTCVAQLGCIMLLAAVCTQPAVRCSNKRLRPGTRVVRSEVADEQIPSQILLRHHCGSLETGDVFAWKRSRNVAMLGV
jgi:hypothetical protein